MEGLKLAVSVSVPEGIGNVHGLVVPEHDVPDVQPVNVLVPIGVAVMVTVFPAKTVSPHDGDGVQTSHVSGLHDTGLQFPLLQCMCMRMAILLKCPNPFQ